MIILGVIRKTSLQGIIWENNINVDITEGMLSTFASTGIL